MDVQTVRYVARLARLAISDAEVSRFTSDLKRVTDYLAQLQQVDTSNVPMTVHPHAERDHWRDDQTLPSLKREQAVANAPESEQGFFQVPPVIE